METAAVVIPVPVTPVEPPAQAAGANAPAQDPGDEASGFASALEQQLAQTAPASRRPAHPGSVAEETETPAAEAEDGGAASSPDALIALIATPYAQPVGQPAPGEAKAVASAAVAHAMPDGRLPVERGDTPEPRAGTPRREPPALAVDDARHTAQAGEHGLPAGPHVAATPDFAATATAAAMMKPPELQQASAAAAAAADAHIAARVGTPQWNDGLAQQVTLMVKDGEHTAQLRLDPPELGPLEVRLTMTRGDDSVAQVQFVSAHAPVRDALEAALPQLRAALAESGITLGQASVGDGYARDDARNAPHPGSGGAGGNGEDRSSASTAPRIIAARGLVDTFA